MNRLTLLLLLLSMALPMGWALQPAASVDPPFCAAGTGSAMTCCQRLSVKCCCAESPAQPAPAPQPTLPSPSSARESPAPVPQLLVLAELPRLSETISHTAACPPPPTTSAPSAARLCVLRCRLLI